MEKAVGDYIETIVISTADFGSQKCELINPDSFRDLLVRITGYSAVFVDVSRGGQEEYLRRMESTL